MGASPRLFQTGAFHLEKGLDADPSSGWGEDDSPHALAATDAFPWTTFDTKLNMNLVEDDSVKTKAFKSAPRMVGQTIDNPLNFYARYSYGNPFYFWMFGFENISMEVVAFKAGVSPFSVLPTVGDVFAIGGEDFAYLRTEAIRDDFIYVFRADDSAAPAAQSGQMLDGEVTFDFTSHSGVMYEHVFELDSYGRRFRKYTTAEAAIHTIDTDDNKNLMATIGKRYDPYDLRYTNAMAKSFSYKYTSPGLAGWEVNYVAHKETTGDYDSADWTFPTSSYWGSNENVPAHFEMRCSLGLLASLTLTNGIIGGITLLGLSDFEMSVDIPVKEEPDTVSGLYIAEPILSGAYGIICKGTISRHTAVTYQTYRNARNPVVLHNVANQGWFMQEFLVKSAIINDSGASDDDVANEPLDLGVEYIEGAHSWADWFYGITEVHDSPILFRTRDAVAAVQMIAQ